MKAQGRIMTIGEASIGVQEAYRAAGKSRCCQYRAGAAIVNGKGEVLGTGSRSLKSGNNLTLCTGNICLYARKDRKCGTSDPIKEAVESVLRKGLALEGATLFLAEFDPQEKSEIGKFSIPKRVACCSGCGELIVRHKLKIALWQRELEEVPTLVLYEWRAFRMDPRLHVMNLILPQSEVTLVVGK